MWPKLSQFGIWLVALVLLSTGCSSIHALLKANVGSEPRQFTFSDNPTNTSNGSQPPATVLTRQLISGTISPSIVTSTSYCVCVPSGSCFNPVPTPQTTDGSGQIDIRIVNNLNVQTTTAPFTCNYGLVSCCQAGAYQCGRRYPPPPGSATAALGQADFGEYPWQVALLTTGDVYLGSGALITSQHVLTAAHKVFNVAITSFKVRVGEWDASSTSEPIPAQDVTIANTFVHPNFNQNNLQNDVAILRLATAVSLSTKSTVGWGRNDFGSTGTYQAILREVDVPLITNSACLAALRSTRLGSGFVLSDSSFICAGGEAGRDACTGDGGSPLVCQSNGIWYVVGLVAWGIGCATGGVPGVYVNVATYLPWIQTVLASG